MQKCTGCLVLKPKTEFHKDRSKAIKGTRSRCKACCSRAKVRNKSPQSFHRLVTGDKKKDKATYDAIYRRNNIAKRRALIAKGRAIKRARTPAWLTAAHYKEIEQFYIEAKELQWLSEEPLHVDHIVPLKGKNVSGLHVPWNLQILPRSLNLAKNNKFGGL